MIFFSCAKTHRKRSQCTANTFGFTANPLDGGEIRVKERKKKQKKKQKKNKRKKNHFFSFFKTTFSHVVWFHGVLGGVCRTL